MDVLVVGGTGLIGHHAALALSARGHRVRVMARRAPTGNSLPAGATFVAGDLAGGDFDKALEGASAVVHAAGTDYRVTPRGSSWEFFRKRNVEASQRLFEAAAKAGVTRAVLVSSFYHAIRPELATHPYIRSRVESEAASLRAAGDKLALCIVQPPYILGHVSGREGLANVLARWVRSRAPLVAPTGGGNFMAARSLGEAIAVAVEEGTAGARYLVGDENISYAEIVSRFARAAGSERSCRKLPASLLVGAAAGATLLNRLRGRESGMIWPEFARTLSGELYYESKVARSALRYPIGLVDEAIREAITVSEGKER